jgi:NADH:ubiquinone oxidoreductase subunit 5 (subunit L)/multisubunit Na+/H+ antiporter MnhA subunit
MMLAMGCGAPVAGIFHLVTHAFFKAMLFLGSGSVITRWRRWWATSPFSPRTCA